MKLIIDIPDMIYNILNGDSSWKGLSVDYILNAVKDGTPLEAQPNQCDSCIHSEEQDGSNCYECVKGMSDNFEAHPTDMTLDEAIEDCEENDYRQIAEWLKELKQWREFGHNNAQFINDCLIQNHIDELYSSEIKNDADILRIYNEVLMLRTTNEFCKSFNERYERWEREQNDKD